MFCRYEDVERLVKTYSSSMFCLIYPKLQSRDKTLKCIEGVFTSYIDKSPKLRSERTEQKWLVRELRKQSGYNVLANSFDSGKLTFIELDNMLTSLRIYYSNEGNKPKKHRSYFMAVVIVLLLCFILSFAVVKGIKHYKGDGSEVQERLNNNIRTAEQKINERDMNLCVLI